jgi:hypothetical protein
MKELSGNEASDTTGFRSGRMPQHSSPRCANYFRNCREADRQETSSALPSPLTPALIHLLRNGDKSKLTPSASSISLPGVGADVWTRKARHPRSSTKISFRFRLRRHWRDSGTLSRITAFGPKLRLKAVAAQAIGPRIPRTFDQCQEIRALSTDMGQVDLEITDDTFTTRLRPLRDWYSVDLPL